MAEEEKEVKEEVKEPQVLCGLSAELYDDGKTLTKTYGTSQNSVVALGLANLLQIEMEALVRRSPGAAPTIEIMLLSKLSQAVGGIGNALIQLIGMVQELKDTTKR